jgi:hypothetical protein
MSLDPLWTAPDSRTPEERIGSLNLVRLHRDGVTVEAVQLTRGNVNAVHEWADSKPYFGPSADGGPMPLTGLTVFTAVDDRVKADFGSWIIRRGDNDFHVSVPGELNTRWGVGITAAELHGQCEHRWPACPAHDRQCVQVVDHDGLHWNAAGFAWSGDETEIVDRAAKDGA